MKQFLFFITGFICAFYLFNTSNNNSKLLQEKIKTLVRQASRWSTAAKQDNNSMIAVLHANYGAGYLWALKDIATDTQIEKATGIDIVKFEKEIVAIQDEATMKMAKLCPDYAPESSYLTKLGGEGN
tara:strand:- start:9 stop:389 length:381 start_codon:yes stop_codon:yes gene_type:complete